MKKLIIILALVIVAGAGIYSLLKKKNSDTHDEPRPKPLSIGANSDAFKESFQKLLTAYYAVKDALVASDSVKANQAARELARASEGLKVNEIKDSTNTLRDMASNYAGTITGSAKGLSGEHDLEAKRKEFQMISETLYDLMRTIKYSGPTVYYAFCPMAFDQAGAHWLNNSSQIQNPYFGSKMLTCGEIQDSLPKK